MFFLHKLQKKKKITLFVFYVVVFDPIKIQTCQTLQNELLNLIFVKDIHIVCKNMTRNGPKRVILKSRYYEFFRNRRYFQQMHQWFDAQLNQKILKGLHPISIPDTKVNLMSSIRMLTSFAHVVQKSRDSSSVILLLKTTYFHRSSAISLNF